jgi:hypothetical protein
MSNFCTVVPTPSPCLDRFSSRPNPLPSLPILPPCTTAALALPPPTSGDRQESPRASCNRRLAATDVGPHPRVGRRPLACATLALAHTPELSHRHEPSPEPVPWPSTLVPWPLTPAPGLCLEKFFSILYQI